MAVKAGFLGTVFQRAQQRALAADDRIDRLVLDPVLLGIPSLDVLEALTDAKVTLTIEGASTLELTLNDPDFLVEQSGVLMGRGDARRLTAVEVMLDGLAYRLAKAAREDSEITLTFEDRLVALLREHNKPMSASRGSMTRAQFIRKMLAEIKTGDVLFYSPEQSITQIRERPDYPDTAPAHGDSGFDPGASFKIKGTPATSVQKREIATALGVADQENAGPRARVAMIASGIGESTWQAIPNRGGSPYGGVLQGKYRSDANGPAQFDLHDTEGMARCFLKGGKGFQGGGAIALAREHPDWSAGRIALEVEGSVSNFSSLAAGEAFYQAGHDEAIKIVEAWKSGSSGGGSDGSSETQTEVKQYQFHRGLPGGKRESSWDAALRLAEEVSWRFYVAGGVAAFVSDDRMLASPAGLVIRSLRDAGIRGGIRYDVDHGKVAQQVEIDIDANLWSLIPGETTVLEGDIFGPIEGAWVNHTIEAHPLDATQATLTLTKPMAPRKEPAADTTTVTKKKDDGSNSSSSDDGGGKKGEVTVSPSANRAGVPIHKQVLDFLRLVAGETSEDIIVGTGTNHRQFVAGTTRQSDHWTGDAADLMVGGTARTSQAVENTGDNIATAALKLIGYSPQEARAMAVKGAASFPGGVFPRGNWRGHSVQVLWKTMEGGDHFNHVHIGVRP
jgi:hypothetical protein